MPVEPINAKTSRGLDPLEFIRRRRFLDQLELARITPEELLGAEWTPVKICTLWTSAASWKRI